VRCTATNKDGTRCKEHRDAWLWMVEEGGALRCRCTSHKTVGDASVTLPALKEWLCRSMEGSAQYPW
jgi:hypothetical protein